MKKYLTLTFLTFFIASTTYAQVLDTLKRDSLIKVLKEYDLRKKELRQADIIPADTQKANLLSEINSCDDNYENSEAWHARFDELKKISYALNYKKGIANALAAEATDLASKQEYKKAMELGRKAMELRERIGDDKGIRHSYFFIGACYQWQNINKDAMPWYMKSLKLAEAVQDSTLLYYIYGGLSGIYQGLGDMKEATSCTEKMAAYVNSPKTKAEYCLALVYVADCYSDSKEFTKADSVLAIAKKIATEMNSFYHLSYYYNIEATVAEKCGNHGEAILAYITSVAMEDSMKAGQNKPYSLRGIADNILKADKQQLTIAGIPESKKYDEVIRYSQLSLDITLPSNIMGETAANYKNLSIAYEAKGDMKQAYKYFKMSTEIKDSLYNAENTKTINGLKMQYESEKQEQQIVLLKKDNLLQQEEVSRQQTTRNSFIGGFAMVILISGVAYNRYRVKQTANRQMAVNLERLRLTQKQLVEQEKMASLGALTAGIAHEIKNPLNFINNFSELNTEIVEDLPTAKSSEELNKMLNYLKINFSKITEHGIRADSIVRNMLAHSNNEVREKELTDVNELCDEYFRISYKAMRVTNPEFKCELKSSFDKEVPKVYMMSQDFSRVLINIFTNAFYAVNEHNTLNPNLKPEVSLTTQYQNNLISIIIKDNGTGMSDATREKIFEPFYTTKPAGQGTGLGLSLSFDIIKAHNGKIKVESKENAFTEFTITLPLTT